MKMLAIQNAAIMRDLLLLFGPDPLPENTAVTPLSVEEALAASRLLAGHVIEQVPDHPIGWYRLNFSEEGTTYAA